MNITEQFDAKYTNNDLQKLKVLLSYMDSPYMPLLSIYIKYQELILSLQNFPTPSSNRDNEEKSLLYASCHETAAQKDAAQPDFLSMASYEKYFSLLHDLSPYCSKNEQEKIHSMESMISNIKSIKDIMEQYELLKDFIKPENTCDTENSSENTQSTLDPETLLNLIQLLQNKN